MLANYVDSMFIHSFYDPSNFVAEFFQNARIEFVQTLPQPRQLREVQAPSAISEKKLLVPRNTKASKKHNGVIMLPW